MVRLVASASAIVLMVALAVGLLAPAASAQAPTVLQADIEGLITQGTATYVQQAIAEAEERGVPLLLRLETPGGLVDATLDIHKSIVRAQVPVLTWVGPSGAEAASAGTLILLMGQPAGMAAGTQIGSAQPITSSPTGETQAAGDKVENFLVERMEQIASRTGRNTTLAAQFITDNLNMGAEEALEAGLIDAVAASPSDFLEQVDGMSAVVGQDGTTTLRTAGARIVQVEPGTLPRVLDFLGNPQVAFVLFMIGLYGLIFGLTNPGTYVPETIGALAILLAFVGFGLFSFATAGLLLLLLGMAFFIAEAFTPTNGLLTVVGVIAVAMAALLLIDEPLAPRGFVRAFQLIGLGAALLSGGVAGFAATVAVRTRKRPPVAFIGQQATAVTAFAGGGARGQVMMEGEIWQATSDHPIADGDVVNVASRHGLRLRVERAEAAGMAADDGEEE